MTSGRTAAATTGTGIKVGNQNNGATLCRLHNVIVTYFNVGFQITANGFNFYSDFQEVIFQNNYQYGFFADAGALLNHSTFTACIFSLTTKPANGGYGFYAVSTGSGMSFRGCYFESNTANGAYFQGTQVANFDGCYFEANLQEDIKINNLYPAINSRLRVENCYIAPSAKLYNKVYLYGCKVFAANNALFGSADNTYPPFFFYPNTGNGGAGNSPAGENISTFVNNSYDAPTLTNIDSSVIIHDSKHGAVTSGAGPAYSTTNTGSFMFNTDTTTNQKVLGWFTRSGGRVNTPLVKNFAGTQITGTTTSGSSIIVLNITTDSPLYEGDYIKMAGVTWNTGSTSVRIEEINTNGDPVTQFSADNSLGPVNMVWRDAVFNSVGNVQGTYTAWSPTLTLSSVAPTTMTYTAGTVGKYVLVGALVYFEGTIVINAFTLGAGAGSIEVNLPPFTGLALSPATFTIGQSSGFVTNQPSLTTYDSTSRFYLSYRATANGASAVMTAAELQANATFSFSGYYLVA